MKSFSLKLFSSLPLIASIGACVDRNVAGGISEETEGVVAITDKTIAGVSQKGPFAKGSSVYLKETKADGSLTPTGKEFYATIRNDAGEFKIENINLESQYALLTAEGFYQREFTKSFSDCSISLNAASDISSRNSTNINLFTHFEYPRILNLVNSGMPFNAAKTQAEKEIFAQFGYEKHEHSAEDLDINGQTEEDRILYEVSKMVDRNFFIGEYIPISKTVHRDYSFSCKEVKTLIDSIANDFAADGILNNSLTEKIAAYSFVFQKENATNVLSRYENLGTCTQDNLGQHTKLQYAIPIEITNMPTNRADTSFTYEYAICTGKKWFLLSGEQFENSTKKIEHQTGSMTDPRDGKTYKTTSFTFKEKTYEWMAENLQFAGDSATQNEENQKGIYTREEALVLKDSSFIQHYEAVLDRKEIFYQGICPEGWHIPNTNEWKALLEYVGSPSNLYSKDWNKIYFTNRILEDNIEFGAIPTFFEPIATNHNSFVPYAHFIAFAYAQINENYSTCKTGSPEEFEEVSCDTKGDISFDVNSDYIYDNTPLRQSNFYSVFFGSSARLLNNTGYFPTLIIDFWNTNYKTLKSNVLDIKLNVRCVKN
ncbi:FISUMP domain-containing protein [Fibrobacter succinogenes]|uniref:Major paralogous domain-containing protein n=1 Tax=Fibrobacter succinogenes TaxID=833 RepID=A0A380RU65_FIBSU|nr:FISUMP domain-containing protein [Fibrobacter succinogenes]PWJ36695.1 uncharacterized protein (TIGR02145 family) [Fibrobacter succinogenes subsp. elongatus]SUQ18944.1 major paralogous domain-containing protein [Fibrobacter succinogenes]